MRWVGAGQGGAIRKSKKFLGQIYCRVWGKYGVYPGAETPDIPDGPDEVHASDVVERGSVGQSASGSSSVDSLLIFMVNY